MPKSPVTLRRPIDGTAIEGAGASYIERAIEALDDDLNSSEAFGAIHDLVRTGNKLVDGAQRGDEAARNELAELLDAFVELTTMLGFTFARDEGASELTGALIDYLLELRDSARAEKAFDRADSIRAKLTELGVAIEDTPAGTRWRLGAG